MYRRALTCCILLLALLASMIPATLAQGPVTPKDTAEESVPDSGLDSPAGIEDVSWRYDFSSSLLTYTELVTGTVHGTASNDDQSFNAINLGFTFTFDGVAYTQVSIQSNGFIAMGGTVSSSYTPLSSGSSNNVVAALGRDIQGNGTTSALWSATEGTAPNRVFTVQWKDYKRYGTAYAGDSFDFQIKLYETSNLVEVVYGQFIVVYNAAPPTIQVGLRGASTADFNNRMTDATHFWANSLPGMANTSSMILTDVTYPPLGLTYDWTLATGVVLDPAMQSGSVCKGGDVVYNLDLVNLTAVTTTFSLVYTSTWPAAGPSASPALAPNEVWPFQVTVHIPWGVNAGDQDTLTVGAYGGGSSDQATATSIAGLLQGWQDYANVPLGREVRAPSVVYYNGKLYKIGGYGYVGGVGAARAWLDIYDIATNTWTQGTDMPGARYWIDCVAIGDGIYCAGGYLTSGQTTLYRYDVPSNSWTTLAPMSAYRYDYAGVTMNGKYYVIGGYGAGYTATLWEYDPATDTWNYSLPSMVTGRRYASAGVIGGKIYIAGGYSPSYLSSVEIYDPVANAWSPGPTMPTTWLTAADGVKHDRYLVLAGGSATSTGVSTNQGWTLDTVTGVWTANPPMAHQLYSAEGDGDGTNFWVVSGRLYEGAYSNSPYTTLLLQCATSCAPVSGADFTWTPDPAWATYPTSFAGTVTAGAPSIQWDWNWGDSTTGSGQNVDHTYATVGTYTVVMTASNCDGANVSVAAKPVPVVVQPTLAVDPDSLSAKHCNQDLSNQTLTLCNTGGAPLTWHMREYSPTLGWGPGTAWEVMTPIPAGRVFGAIVAAGPYVFAIGGTSDAAGTLPVSTTLRYDTRTNTWATVAPVPAPLGIAFMDGAAVGNQIYIPGSDAPVQDNNTYVYDVAADTWTIIPTNNGYVAGEMYGAVALGTNLYVLGGIVGAVSVPNVWVLDTVAGTWSVGVPMQKQRINMAAEAVGGKIYALGGVAYPGFTPDMTSEVFDGTSWSYVAPVPDGGGAYTRWSYMADGADPAHVWLAAGRRDTAWAVLNHAGTYNVLTDDWTTSPDYPVLNQARVYLEGDIAAGYMYAMGGRDSAGAVIYDVNERLFTGYLDIPWLDENLLTGVIPGGSCADVTVSFDSTGMPDGNYFAGLLIESNDPVLPEATVPVTLAIGCPDIVVTPPSLEAAQCPDTVTTQTLSVCNNGVVSLDWELEELSGTVEFLSLPLYTPPTLIPEGPGPDGRFSDYDTASYQPNVPGQGHGPTPPARYRGIDALTYYSDRGAFDTDFPGLPVEGYENGSMPPGTVDSVPHPLDQYSSNAYFDPGDILPGIQFWSPGGTPGMEIAVLGANFMGNPSKTAVANTFTQYYRVVFDPPVEAAGMDLQDFMGSGSCQVDIYDVGGGLMGSTTSACSNAGVFWGVASDGLPIAEIVIISLGGGAEGADNIAFGNAPAVDVPWLSEAPVSGTVPVGECQDVVVAFDSTGLTPGDYFAGLLISSDDPDTPEVTVPVTLTVNTLPDIAVTAPPLEAGLCPSATTTIDFALCNNGECLLDWTLSELSETLPLRYVGQDVTVHAPAVAAPANAAARVPAVARPARDLTVHVGWVSEQDITVLLVTPDVVGGGDISLLLSTLAAFPDLVVTLWDGNAGTPTVADMQAYDVVFVGNDILWTSSAIDKTALSNNLADFIDAGGKVLASSFIWSYDDWGFGGGRFLTEDYSPYEMATQDFWDPITLGTFDPAHPIMAGITAVSENYNHQDPALSTNGTWVASWLDGENFVAVAPGCVGLNALYFNAADFGGQAGEVLHNAILFLATPPAYDVPWLSEDPVAGSVIGGECATVTVTFDSAGMAPGTYTAGLLLQSNDPDTPAITLPVTMTVNPLPAASFLYDPTAGYVPLTVTFTDTSVNAISPTWTFGDGGTGAGAIVTHTYTTAGDFTATLTVQSRYGCRSDTFAALVQAVQPGVPIAGFESSTPDCLGETTTFTNTTVGTGTVTYLWAFGDGITSTLENPTHLYAAAGTYAVTLTATSASGSDTATHDVVIGEAVSGAEFTWLPTNPNAGDTVAFTGTVAAGSLPITWSWDFGDGGTGTGMTVTHVFAAGTYTVTLTVSNDCGTTTAVHSVVVSVGMYYIYLPLVTKSF